MSDATDTPAMPTTGQMIPISQRATLTDGVVLGLTVQPLFTLYLQDAAGKVTPMNMGRAGAVAVHQMLSAVLSAEVAQEGAEPPAEAP